jgi:plasmid stabilization system protein ParE
VTPSRYDIQPKADTDLEEQAFYYATRATPELGHRFLVAAHDTFALLATHPNMGWHCQLKHPALRELRIFRVAGFERIMILYKPLSDGVSIVGVAHGSRNLQRFLVDSLD